jgi:hypothetical protein
MPKVEHHTRTETWLETALEINLSSSKNGIYPHGIDYGVALCTRER